MAESSVNGGRGGRVSMRILSRGCARQVIFRRAVADVSRRAIVSGDVRSLNIAAPVGADIGDAEDGGEVGWKRISRPDPRGRLSQQSTTLGRADGLGSTDDVQL